MSETEYLYHYTNISALALILANRTIRFNSLDHMDDLQEKMTADLKRVAQFCYVSSWTDDEQESIPMWNMYASLDSGVRIRLCKRPFRLHEIQETDIVQVPCGHFERDANGRLPQIVIPFHEMLNKGFTYFGPPPDVPFPVIYTNDESKLYPQMRINEEDHIVIPFGELGKYKNDSWGFQKEWRYRILVMPFDFHVSMGGIEANGMQFVNNVIEDKADQLFPYYDLSISDEAFRNMEITISPRFSAGNRIILQSLLGQYNPDAQIKESELAGLL